MSSISWSYVLFMCYGLSQLLITSGQEYEYKCKFNVDLNEILCEGNHNPLNLSQEFERLSAELEDNQKIIANLEIKNVSIDEIPENAFADIGFHSINILEASNLSVIHTNAFGQQLVAQLTNKFMVDKPSNLRNSPPDYDLYKALNSLQNVAYIQISLQEKEFHLIPDNAFVGKQNNLQYLVFVSDFLNFDGGFAISRIGSKSFQALSSLTSLSFHHVLIENISSDAFFMNEASDNRLTINLEDCMLWDDNIEENSFTGSKRPVTLNLADNLIQYIREEKFKSFLDENSDNRLQFYGNPLKCYDLASFRWLIENKDQYRNQIEGPTCDADTYGASLWDLEYLCDSVDSYSVFCNYSSTQTLNLLAECQRLSDVYDQSQRAFLAIYTNANIVEIPENAFADLVFEHIFINESKQLHSIHTNAFVGNISQSVKRLSISSPSSLENLMPEHNLYSAFNSLTNLKVLEITLKERVFHEIPENAFSEPQNQLKSLTFYGRYIGEYTGYGIVKLGGKQFRGLSSLKTFYVRNAIIQNISSDAFHFDQQNDITTTIVFNNNRLTDDSLDLDCFVGSQRHLDVWFVKNEIEFIREEKFSKFLSENANNSLNFDDNLINCFDIKPFLWLLCDRNRYQNQVFDAFCYNGTNIWDLKDLDCPNTATTTTTPTGLAHKLSASNLILVLISIIYLAHNCII